MPDRPERPGHVDEVRRKLLKASAVAGGSLALGSLPYQKPEIKSFFGVRSAWAQATSFLEINMAGQLGVQAPGTPDPSASQDAYEFQVLSPNTQLTITATPDGNIDPEIFLYGPNPAPPPFAGLTNLLTGTPFGLNAAGVGGVESAIFTAVSAGRYVIAIEDERAPAAEVAGTYSIKIIASQPIGPPSTVHDEGPESDQPETGGG